QRLGNKELYIIYTHSDFDHIIGSGAFPKAKVIATKALQMHPNKENIMKEIYDFDQQYYIERNYTPVYPDVHIPIDSDGEEVKIGDLSLIFYTAPGHTIDSLFTIIEPYGIFLAGDYLSDVEFPFIHNYKDYVNTMDKASFIMEKYDLRYLV